MLGSFHCHSVSCPIALIQHCVYESHLFIRTYVPNFMLCSVHSNTLVPLTEESEFFVIGPSVCFGI